MKNKIALAILLLSSSASAQFTPESAPPPRCVTSMETSKMVTHYYVPLLESYDHHSCHEIEGTCIYKKNGQQWLHNYGYQDQLLSQARCKNGYGNQNNCLNPCRTVAASTAHHRFGEILYMKNLVGKRCGNMARDGFEMIHDGYVMVADTGSPIYFNQRGRFDYFWGRCKNKTDGVCHEGAAVISDALTTSSYCMVWNPATPGSNVDLRNWFRSTVKAEALQRGDTGAAAEF